MNLTETQIEDMLDTELPEIMKYMRKPETIEIRKNHPCKSKIIEFYVTTWTKCGDPRKQIFGVCGDCKTQLYHFEKIVALEHYFPSKYVEE